MPLSEPEAVAGEAVGQRGDHARLGFGTVSPWCPDSIHMAVDGEERGGRDSKRRDVRWYMQGGVGSRKGSLR